MTFDKHIFISITQQCQKFKTTTIYTISLKRTNTILIHMFTGQKVEISRVSYIPHCTSNLLSLSQLKATSTSYHDGGIYIILKIGNKGVA